MRTKGALGTTPISLATLNSFLKPNATIMVSKKFAQSIMLLSGDGESPTAVFQEEEQEEQEEKISIQTY